MHAGMHVVNILYVTYILVVYVYRLGLIMRSIVGLQSI